MMIGKNAAAALAAAALGLALLCQPGIAMADEVTVTKNGTPLTQAPTRNAPTEWKVNSGFPLTVVEERDGWIQVESHQLPDEAGERLSRWAAKVSHRARRALSRNRSPTGWNLRARRT
jgi:hypothetical protein